MARNLLMALGYGFLGAGMLREAFGEARGKAVQAPAVPDGELSGPRRRRSLSGLGDVGRPLAGEDARARKELAAGAATLTRGTIHNVRNIDERVAFIRKALVDGSKRPEVRAAAVAQLSRKCQWKNGVRWCTTPKDYAMEVNTLYKAMQDPANPLALRYVRDHAKLDQFTSASKLVQFVRGGDCDDGTIKLGALLMAVGYPVKMRVIQSVNSDTWDHIYLLAGIPPGGNNTRWVPLDWSIYPFKPAGWEAPREMVRRVKDYEV